MILSRNQISLKGQVVFEKLVIQPPFRFPGDFPSEGCFLFFSGGRVRLAAPDGMLRAGSGEGILLGCGHYLVEFNEAEAGTPCEVFAIHLLPDVLQPMFTDDWPALLQAGPGPHAAHVPTQAVLNHFVDSLRIYFDHSELLSMELMEVKLRELVLLLMQTRNAPTARHLFTSLFPQQATISQVVHAHLYSNLSLEELAVLCGLSLSTFKRNFRQQFQDSPARYIREKRLQRAAQLLSNPQLSIAQVAWKSGFNDAAHFTRLFHERFGHPPTDFREKMQVTAD